MADHAERAHASLGASSAYRWMACPGSIRLSEGIPDRTSGYALEGTAAHELAQLCLEQMRGPDEFIDRQVGGVTVTADMAGAVQVYIDRVCALNQPGDLLLIEHRFSLEGLTAGTDVAGIPMFGTADLVLYKPDSRELHVLDYKHGAGVPVRAKGNAQGRYYALGAVLSLQDRGVNPSSIHIEIVQPRAARPGDGPEVDVVEPMELIEWSADLLDAARATLAIDAPLATGAHCRFCKAAALCPAQQRLMLTEAQSEFTPAGTLTVPPEPASLPPERIGQILNAADTIEQWLSAVRAHALGELEAGRTVPGWKLVEGRLGNRAWVNEADASLELLGAGLSEDEIYEKKIISPSQAEKAIGKTAMKAFAGLVDRKPGRPALAPLYDKRPAIAAGAATDFAAIAT